MRDDAVLKDTTERTAIYPKNELDYTCGISDDELTRRFKESIRIDEEIRTILGLPQARYDDITRKAYLEYPDGRREYVGKTST